MTPEDLDRALSVALEAGEAAGALLMAGFRSGTQVKRKGTAIDLVTEHDLSSETLIRQRLGGAFPEHRIVGEEQDPHGEGDRVWFVDPLDGTTNFAHGHPGFCVSIALYDGDEAMLGVVVAPALGITWHAVRGGGAFRAGEPCQVSETATLSQALCATGFPYDRWTNPDSNLAELTAFLRCTHGVRRCGSAAIDLAFTADGTYDLFWEQRLQAWDMCAGALLVVEAGGCLTDYDGGPADPRRGRVVASNGRFHDDVIHVIAHARARAGLPPIRST